LNLLILLHLVFGLLFLSIIKFTVFCAISKTQWHIEYYLIFLVMTTLTAYILGTFGHIVQVVLLIILGFKFNRRTQSIHLIYFYGLYAVLSVSAFGTIIQSLGTIFLPIRFLSYNTTTMYETILSPVIIGILQYFIIKLISPNLTIIRKNQYFQKSNRFKFVNLLLSLSLLSYLLIPLFKNNEYKATVNIFFAISVVSLLIYLKNTTQNYFNLQLAEQRQQQLNNLTDYTTEIETLYKNINGFRHDYINLIISLETSIQKGDIKQIREIYNNVLKKSPNILNHDHYSLGALSNITIPAIKSLLSHKIIYALEKGIHTEIEIEQQWTSCHMDTLDYIRILGILLDNAIEASEKNVNAFIHIAVIIDSAQKENRLIIENATTEETSPIHQIFKHRVTTKGNDHGTGLHNVQQILIEYEQAHLETAHANHIFNQTLVTQG